MSINPENIRALEAVAGQWAARSRTAPESDEAHAFREDARELLELARTCRAGDAPRARRLLAELDDELRGLVPFVLVDDLLEGLADG